MVGRTSLYAIVGGSGPQNRALSLLISYNMLQVLTNYLMPLLGQFFMKTYSQSKEDAAANSKWFVVDADGQVLGRLASKVASMLLGKGKATFTRHVSGGDFVVVTNAKNIVLTGKKAEKKIYKHHTGYIGGVKEISAGDLREKNPARMIEQAVWGMLPKGPLGRDMLSKLKVYSGTEHPHAAQAPVAVKL